MTTLAQASPAGTIPPEGEWQDAGITVFQAHGAHMRELFFQYVGEGQWPKALDLLESAMEQVPDTKVASCQHVRQHLESLKR